MIYDFSHRTTFSYAGKVALSQHLLHLAPRSCPQQTRHHHSLLIEPVPTWTREDSDFFGNPTTYLIIEEPHNQLTITAASRVEITALSPPPPETTIPWDKMTQVLAQQSDSECLDAYQFAFDSRFTVSSNAADYAEVSFPPGRPLLEGAIDLMSRIYHEFKYEGGVTEIHTPVDRVLAGRLGVCQDFSHLQIACLRSLGLPARYVSGYLLTHPPEGREKKIGADASHAWLAIWIPGHGWIDLDPTNNLVPGDEHITIAWGRDYGDVSPINGMVIGGGDHTVEVAVDVRQNGS